MTIVIKTVPPTYIIESMDIFELAQKGFKLFPVNGKRPAIDNWQQLATIDPSVIAEWSSTHKGNWGALTGLDSGIIVIDVDVKNGGIETWTKLNKKDRIKTWVAVTGTGGLHYYFKQPKFNVGNSVQGLGPGLDIRGSGGLIVVPPSVNADGNAYTWKEGHSPADLDLAEMPMWLTKLVKSIVNTMEFADLGSSIPEGVKNDTIYHHSLVLFRQGSQRDFVKTTMITWLKSARPDTYEKDLAEIDSTIESAFKAFMIESSKKIATSGRTDTDNADKLIEKYGDDIFYVDAISWHNWSKTYWEPDTNKTNVTALAQQCMRDMRTEAEAHLAEGRNSKQAEAQLSWANASLSAGKIHAMVDLAKLNKKVKKKPEDLDPVSSTFLLNCKNGVVDLRTGKLSPHVKSLLITKYMDINYNPEAVCPEFERTLHLAFQGDQSLIDFMQRALGYTITGSTAEQCLFIAWGEQGANGKSTILEAIQRMLNTYAMSADVLILTAADYSGSRIQSSLAGLRGARMVNLNEAAEGVTFNEALVKQLTGGDTVECCLKFKNPFSYIPVFKLWMRTNEKPNIRSLSESMWRRIITIPFENTIPKDQRKSRDVVDAELAAEAEGILAWLVRGSIQWYANTQESGSSGLKPPDKVVQTVKEYKDENNIIKMFLDEMITPAPKSSIDRATMFTVFKDWCESNNYRMNISVDVFQKKFIKSTGLTWEKIGRNYALTGYKLRETSF